MTGCWRGADGAGTVEERIGPADANIMLSTSRYLEGGRVASFEFLQFEARPDKIVMIPYLNGRRAGEFTLEPGEYGVAVFADPQHDFPKRVIYRKDGDGLQARVVDASSDHRLTIVGKDTIPQAEPFVRRVPGAVSLSSIPPRLTQSHKTRVLYMRSQHDHMGLVTTGKALPVLLGRAPLPDRARYGWVRSAPPRW